MDGVCKRSGNYLPVMIIPGVECDNNLLIPSLCQDNPVGVIRVLKQGYNHS